MAVDSAGSARDSAVTRRWVEIKELDSAFMTEWRRDDPQTKNWQRAKRVPARLGRPPRK
jgi:hypothetical protein